MSKTVVGNTNLATVAANSVKGNPTADVSQPTDLVLGTNQFVGNVGTGLAAVTLSAGGGLSLVTSIANTAAIDGSYLLTLINTLSTNIQPGIAKAWVNFDGTGTNATNQTIRSSYNVNSVYKTGAGKYTITLTNSMANANYIVATTGTTDATGNGGYIVFEDRRLGTRSVNTFYIATAIAATYTDGAQVSVTVFGN